MAKSIADELMERRAALIKGAQDIAQAGVSEDRDLTVEEQTAFDQKIAEAGKLHERAKAIFQGEQSAHDLERSFREVTGHDPAPNEADKGKLGEWARSARLGDGFDLMPVQGAERRAMNRAISYRSGGGEQRAMDASGGTGADGVYGTLWEYATSASQILQAGVDIVNTADGNTLPFPVATAHVATSDTAVAANGAIDESDPTITTVESTVSKYPFMTYVPSELVQDVTFDLSGYIARSAGRALAKRIAVVANTAYVSGFNIAGATGPQGTDAGFGDQSTVGQGTDLIYDLFHSVLPEYRTSAAWMMADPTAAAIRKLKGSDGQSVWQPALTAGDPDLVVGKPVYFDPNLPSPAASKKSVYFGDWSALKIRIAGGLRFERSDDYRFGNDQIAFRGIVRTGAVTIDPNAVKYFVHGTAAA